MVLVSNKVVSGSVPCEFSGAGRMKEKILIVDDDKTTASVMQLYIVNIGYEVTAIAADGKDAINLARDLQPDLVLMDIFLGKGLDGIDATEIIQKHFKIPVVFVTSHADETTLNRAKAAEPQGYINKPLRETDLKTAIEFALEKSKPRPKKVPGNTISMEELLASLYSLTRMEAKVAAKLVEYPELGFVSAALNISTSTARTHLKRIYRKTGTNRQSVLIHKIVSGPAGLLMNRTD